MSDNYQKLSERLDQLEQQALDYPEQLFALSYVRSHLDLLNLETVSGTLSEALKEAVHSTFDTDNMSQQDREDILTLIDRLADA